MEQRIFIKQRRIEFLQPESGGNSFVPQLLPAVPGRGSKLSTMADEDEATEFYPSVFYAAPSAYNYRQHRLGNSDEVFPSMIRKNYYEPTHSNVKDRQQFVADKQSEYVVSRQPCAVFDDPTANMSLLYQAVPDLTSDESRRRGISPFGVSNFKNHIQNNESSGYREITPRKRQIDQAGSSVNAPAKPQVHRANNLRADEPKQLNYNSGSKGIAEPSTIKSKAPTSRPSGPPEIVILTANVKCSVEWYSQVAELKKYHVLFEIFAILQRIREHDLYYELLLRDRSGPLLQTLFYKMDQPLPEIACGQVVRVIGRLLARTRLQAYSVREAKPGEMQRHDLYLSNQSLKTMKRIEEQDE